jgi:copper chaperone CopZ
MNRNTTRAFRWLAPLAGITLLSGVASAKVVTEAWEVKGVHTPADETKIKDALNKLPSVTKAVVHMTNVRVTYDDEKLQESAIKDSVAKAGSFELTSKMPEKAKATSANTSSSGKSSSKAPAKSTTTPK